MPNAKDASPRCAAALPSASAVLLCACSALPYGETLVVVDTDVSVPHFVGALRVDLFTPDGTWTESRDFPAFDRQTWPLSFALRNDGEVEKTMRVRLRAYPEGRLRDYRGERYEEPHPLFTPLKAAQSLDELCASAPLLPPLTELTQRIGGAPITSPMPTGSCPGQTGSGSVAVRVQIPQRGAYRFEVVRLSSQDPSLNQTTLYLRSDCAQRDGEVACADNADVAHFSHLVVADLRPGAYTLICTGGPALFQPMDVTMRWSRADQWDLPSVNSMQMGPSSEPGPFLVVDGIDMTPPREPRPPVSIDRIADVSVRPHERHAVMVTLLGECVGTMADLRHGRSCLATSGQLDSAPKLSLNGWIDHNPTSASGTWPGEQVVTCTSAPRPPGTSDSGTPLMDEEVCIPGGAFLIGDASAPFDPSESAEMVAIVEPFLLQKYELTVGRYRQALRDGFSPIDASPLSNNAPLSETVQATWNGGALAPHPRVGKARESFPLNAITPREAGALCRFFGGDLPTEAQWEFAATAAGRSAESRYPSGESAPGCDGAVYGRATDPSQFDAVACSDAGTGLVAVSAAPWGDADVTASGVHGMTGNLTEVVLGSHRPLSDPCWRTTLLRDVACNEQDTPFRVARGGSWNQSLDASIATFRLHAAESSVSQQMGLRCARPGRTR